VLEDDRVLVGVGEGGIPHTVLLSRPGLGESSHRLEDHVPLRRGWELEATQPSMSGLLEVGRENDQRALL
jgi:hypothetical protein